MPYSTLLRRSLAALLVAGPLAAQQQTTDSSRAARNLDPVTITATRVKTDVHNVAPAVSVLDSTTISRRLPNTAADLLRELPGVDVIGTGVNQARPAIRGEQGQRCASPRRRNAPPTTRGGASRNFGELPALVDVFQIDRVEVVRGPSSVLYGTDAIGGVINLITRAPRFGVGSALSGRAGYEYSDNGGLGKAQAYIDGRQGNWAFEIGGSGRVAGDYTAPAGSYGNVHLANKTTMMDSGVRDHNIVAYLGWRGASGNGLFAKVEQYVADNAGFGWIPPTLLPGDQPLIQIRYPHQDFQKLTVGFNSGALQSATLFADKVDVTTYVSGATPRILAQHIFADFGAGNAAWIGRGHHDAATGPTWETIGARVEAMKVFDRVVLTYGEIDFFRDNSCEHGFQRHAGDPVRPDAKTADEQRARRSERDAHEQPACSRRASSASPDRLSLTIGGRLQSVSSTPEITANPHGHAAEPHAVGGGLFRERRLSPRPIELAVVRLGGTRVSRAEPCRALLRRAHARRLGVPNFVAAAQARDEPERGGRTQVQIHVARAGSKDTCSRATSPTASRRDSIGQGLIDYGLPSYRAT